MHTQAYKHEPHPRNHETPNTRKVQEDRDKAKEKHGMKHHPPAPPTQHAHALSIGDGHGPRRDNNGMANKYVKSPYTLHHPHNVSIGVEPSMLKLRRRAPKGPDMHTQAYKHEPRPRNHETPNARKVQEDGDQVKEKHGMRPHPPSQPRAHPCHPPRAPPEGDRCSAVRDRHSPLSCAQSPRLHHAPIPQGCSPAAQRCPDAYPHSIVRCRPGHQRPQCARSAVRVC